MLTQPIWPYKTHRLSLGTADPIAELDRVRSRGGQKYHVRVIRQHDNNFLPDHSPLGVIDVVHLSPHQNHVANDTPD